MSDSDSNTVSLTLQDILARLDEASRGLLFPSESDFPFETIELAEAPLDQESLRRALGVSDDAPLEEMDVRALLEPVIESCEGSEADQYKEMIDIFDQYLSEGKSIRAGRVEIDIFMIGRHDSGAWVGLKTKAVET